MEQKKKKLIAAIFSVLLHLLLVLALIHTSKIEKHKKKKYPPGGEVVHLLPFEQSKSNKQIKKAPGDPAAIHEKKCDHGIQYKGIGIQYTLYDMVIAIAPPGYPAYEAGLRVGDEIMDMTPEPNEDGYMDFIVKRNNEILKFHIKAEMICYNKEALKP